ncbi:MAG: DUF883 family protein [Planctomycetes bacterium]|nr:DUF883 family protein [Planctomycetota bacterium]
MTTTSATEKILTPARPGMEGDSFATTLGQRVEHARERVGEVAHRVKERALEKEQVFEGYVRLHPVKSVLVAAGIGAGLGLVIGTLLARR